MFRCMLMAIVVAAIPGAAGAQGGASISHGGRINVYVQHPVYTMSGPSEFMQHQMMLDAAHERHMQRAFVNQALAREAHVHGLGLIASQPRNFIYSPSASYDYRPQNPIDVRSTNDNRNSSSQRQRQGFSIGPVSIGE